MKLLTPTLACFRFALLGGMLTAGAGYSQDALSNDFQVIVDICLDTHDAPSQWRDNVVMAGWHPVKSAETNEQLISELAFARLARMAVKKPGGRFNHGSFDATRDQYKSIFATLEKYADSDRLEPQFYARTVEGGSLMVELSPSTLPGFDAPAPTANCKVTILQDRSTGIEQPALPNAQSEELPNDDFAGSVKYGNLNEENLSDFILFDLQPTNEVETQSYLGMNKVLSIFEVRVLRRHNPLPDTLED